MGFAYWTSAHREAMTARDCPAFVRIAPGGPWRYRDHVHNGVAGVLAEWLDHDGGMAAYRDPVACYDGLIYFASKAPLRQEDLAKRNAPAGIDYTTAAGYTLTIPLATAAPRFLAFGPADAGGELVGEFAQLAARVFDRLQAGGLSIADPELRRLILLAVGQCYRVTAEPLADLRWITTADVDPILCCLMGSDPKALPDAGNSSPSPLSGSPTSP